MLSRLMKLFHVKHVKITYNQGYIDGINQATIWLWQYRTIKESELQKLKTDLFIATHCTGSAKDFMTEYYGGRL